MTIVIANVLIYLATAPIISIIPSFTKKINLKKIQSGKIIFFHKLKISFVLTFLITILEFFDRRVKTIKKDAELMSPGTL